MGYGTATLNANHWTACIGDFSHFWWKIILGVGKFMLGKIAKSTEIFRC